MPESGSVGHMNYGLNEKSMTTKKVMQNVLSPAEGRCHAFAWQRSQLFKSIYHFY